MSNQTEIDWRQAVCDFTTESNPQNKAQRAIKVREACEFFPEARSWVLGYLQDPQKLALTHPSLAFLLSSFIDSPSREEVKRATCFWNKRFLGCVDETSMIILNGEKLLTEDEKLSYAQRAKDFFEKTKKDLGQYNFGAQFIKIVARFEGEPGADWIAQILTYDYFCPRAESAYQYATRFDPAKAAEALVLNLRQTPLNNLARRAWVADRVIPHIKSVSNPQDLILVGTNLIEIANYKTDHVGEQYAVSSVRDTLASFPKQVRIIARAFSNNHPLRKQLTAYIL